MKIYIIRKAFSKSTVGLASSHYDTWDEPDLKCKQSGTRSDLCLVYIKRLVQTSAENCRISELQRRTSIGYQNWCTMVMMYTNASALLAFIVVAGGRFMGHFFCTRSIFCFIHSIRDKNLTESTFHVVILKGLRII